MKKGMKQVCVSMAVVPLVWLNLGITQPLQVEVKAEETKEKEVKKEANTGAAKQLSKEEYAKLSAEEGLGNVLEATVTDNVITLKIDNGDEAEDDYLEISPLANNLLKVNLRPRNIENSPSTPMIDPNATFTAIGATIDLESDPMIISTDECTLEIAKEPARMTFKDKNGKTLLSESADGGIFDGGVRFKRGASDHVYGAYGISFSDGDLGMERDNTAADSNKTAQAGQQGNAGGPFMWSTAGYGLLVDSDGGYPYSVSDEEKLEFYYGDTVVEGRRYVKENVEMYLMSGEPEEIMSSYADVTGHTPMMPKWSLGFSNFEWGTNETEFRENINTYRAKGIPIDSFAFDYDWKFYGDPTYGGDYGEFAWNTENFPSAKDTTLKSDMDALGVKMIGITKPRVVTNLEDGTATQQGKDAEANGYWYPGQSAYEDYAFPVTVRSIDPYNEDERNWWWSHSEDALDKGIVGWWNDETDKVSSNGADYWFGNFTTGFTSEAMYEGQRDYTNERVWQTGRTFYPGAQRYSTSTWSGDIGVQWKKGEVIDWANGMQEQPSTMLSTINLGQTKWGMDTGGFNANSGQVLNPDPELYSRWMEFSSLVPVFRTHGNQNQQRQPWFYGGTAEEVAKSSMTWRYSMIPYMYAYERQAYDSGVGLVQPLTFDNPTDENVVNLTDEWMFGDGLLVAPVLEEGAGSRDIYLPAGTWIDYNRGDVYEGNQTISYEVNDDDWTDVPMFVKQGAIMPMQQPQNYVGESAVKTIYLDTFASDKETSFTHYDDDGKSFDYEKDTYLKQKMTTSKTADGSGYAVGSDVYGAVTYVKVPAQADADTVITTSGSASVVQTGTYEMETGSNFADTVADKPVAEKTYVDGYDKDGAGTTIYANVKDSGDYNVDLTYKNASADNQSLSIFVNGDYVKQTTLKPNTDWSVQSEALPLSAGKNSISYKVVTDTGDKADQVSLDKVNIGFTPTVAKVEAEEADLAGTLKVANDHWFYSGEGFVGGFGAAGDEIKFEVDVPADGEYVLNTRTANGTGMPQTLDLYTNGDYNSRVTFPSEGENWNIWSDTEKAVNLKAGTNKITFLRDGETTGNVNIDRILVSAEPINSPVQSEVNLLDNGGFERDAAATTNWVESHPDGQDKAYGVDSGSGVNPPESPAFGKQSAYFYLPGAYKQTLAQQIAVPVNNANYDVEAWVKVSNDDAAKAQMTVNNYDSSDGKTIDLVADDVWHYVTMKDVKVTTGNINTSFQMDSPGGTSIHIDNVRVMPSAE
ncbi:TPA: carbohydrate-binding protein [Listeria monocytogenes]|nr:carbohydrate-binding protein [Listeria monocytogenes]HDT8309181.1 carbohydrate-binding protein [Listeria monocytogenes]HDT8500281.1 carbohydrate-binding protein [Listeria monocytogenes]HEL6580893.1 carbohydrate-binding protein [Listeria monocytogenes]HEM0260919.1 carbohydrate-binding protein [Listeria monocytogenes]